MFTKSIKKNLLIDRTEDMAVASNCLKCSRSLFFVPLVLLSAILIFLSQHGALNTGQYIQIQKDWFYLLNIKLSHFPIFIINLTQLGDEIVMLSLFSILVIYAPKVWEAILSASLVSCIFSISLKKIFAVPRPAAVFDHHTFVIIGKTLNGHNSLPSGHSITAFTILTVLLFGFMPQRSSYKTLWYSVIIGIGLMVILTRVGVGAHYPLDTIIGGLIGYISGLLGISINIKYNIWSWVMHKKYYPIFMLLFLIFSISIMTKIRAENLFIFYVAFVSLITSLYKIIHDYIKK